MSVGCLPGDAVGFGDLWRKEAQGASQFCVPEDGKDGEPPSKWMPWLSYAPWFIRWSPHCSISEWDLIWR